MFLPRKDVAQRKIDNVTSHLLTHPRDGYAQDNLARLQTRHARGVEPTQARVDADKRRTVPMW